MRLIKSRPKLLRHILAHLIAVPANGKAVGFCCENLVFSDQTHTTNIRVVTEADRGKGYAAAKDYTDVDGMVTNIPGLTLATFYADCVPLFLVGPLL